jgi:hypothetical protein
MNELKLRGQDEWTGLQFKTEMQRCFRKIVSALGLMTRVMILQATSISAKLSADMNKKVGSVMSHTIRPYSIFFDLGRKHWSMCAVE